MGLLYSFYVYKSDVAPRSVQRILEISSCGRAFYICLLLWCDRLPVSPDWCVYIICHVVYREHWITLQITCMLRHFPVLSVILSRFFMFHLKSWMISYCSLFKKYWCFFQKFWWSFQDISGFFRIFQIFHVFF